MSKVVYKISKLLDNNDDLYDSYEKTVSDDASSISQSLSVLEIEDVESLEEEDDYEEEKILEPCNPSKFVSPIRPSLFDGGDSTIRFLKEYEIASPPLIMAAKLKFRAARAPKVVQNMLRRMGFDLVKSKGWFGTS